MGRLGNQTPSHLRESSEPQGCLPGQLKQSALSLSCRSLPPASPPWAWALGGPGLGGEKTTDGAVRGRGCGCQMAGEGAGMQASDGRAPAICVATMLGEQNGSLGWSRVPSPIRSAVTCSGRRVPSWGAVGSRALGGETGAAAGSRFAWARPAAKASRPGPQPRTRSTPKPRAQPSSSGGNSP